LGQKAPRFQFLHGGRTKDRDLGFLVPAEFLHELSHDRRCRESGWIRISQEPLESLLKSFD
jgi:hypothetical protein